MESKEGSSVRSGKAPWIHRQPEIRDGSIQTHPKRSAANCRRGGMAIQPSHPARAHHAQGANPYACKLERDVAGPGRDVESQRIAHKSGSEVFHAVERELRRRLFYAGSPA